MRCGSHPLTNYTARQTSEMVHNLRLRERRSAENEYGRACKYQILKAFRAKRLGLAEWVAGDNRFGPVLEGRYLPRRPRAAVAMRTLTFYLLRTLKASLTMRAPTVAAAPPSTPFVIVS